MIVTFYSFKGGVGRSMALVNVAEILADRGFNVVVCDWDLEAPGLERYFTSREFDDELWQKTLDELITKPGLVDLLSDYRDAIAMPNAGSTTGARSGAEADQYVTLGPISVRRPSSVAVAVSESMKSRTTRRGSIRLLTAGRRDGVFQQSYAEVVRAFDWEEFYTRWAGGAYIEFFRHDLLTKPEGADIVLVDSRTGVTEQGGICTHHLADLVVLLTAANDANLAGIQWMAETLSDERLLALRGGRPLEVLPVAARIDIAAEVRQVVDFRNRFSSHFTKYIGQTSGMAVDPKDFAFDSEIPYLAYYSFTEQVVAREPQDRRERNLYSKYDLLASVIVANGVKRGFLTESDSQTPAVARRRSTATRARQAVYLSVPEPYTTLVKKLAAGLREVGMDVLTIETMRPDGWREISRIVVVDRENPVPPYWQRAEWAEAVRQTATGRNNRLVSLVSTDGGVRSVATPSVFFNPSSDEPQNEFFESLANELADGEPVSVAESRDFFFPGREPFGQQNAAAFFGRDTELREFASAARQGVRWFHIHGPSGIGKTSFVTAGVLPMISRGEITGIPYYARTFVIRGGSDMGATLDRMVAERGLASLTEAVKNSVAVVVAEDCNAFGTGADLWIDQHPLLDLVQQGKVLFIGTSHQADPLDRVASIAMIPSKTIELRGLSMSDARLTLTARAALAGLTFEKGLPERIVSELADVSPAFGDAETPRVDPSLLSLIATSVIDTQEKRITHEQYDMGGVSAERLVRSAADAYGRVSDSLLARLLFADLITAEGASRRIAYSRAARKAGGDVLDQLSSLRLIRISDFVEMRHPLFARWVPFLREIAALNEDKIDPADAAVAARQTWDAVGHKPSSLARAATLEFFSSGVVIDRRTKDYLKASSWQAFKRKFLTGTAVVLAAVVIVLLAPYLWTGLSTRYRAYSLARQARSRGEQGLPLAIAAAEEADTNETRAVLRSAIQQARVRAVVPTSGHALAAGVAAAPVGGFRPPVPGQVVFAISPGEISAWNIAPETHGFVAGFEFPDTLTQQPIGVNRTGTTITTVIDGFLQPFRLEYDTIIGGGRQFVGTRSVVAQAPDGLTTFAADGNKITVYFDVDHRFSAQNLGTDTGISAAAVTPDYAVAGSKDGWAHVWLIVGLFARAPSAHFRVFPRGVSSISVSSDGTRALITGGADGTEAAILPLPSRRSSYWPVRALRDGTLDARMFAPQWLLVAKKPLRAPRNAFGNHGSLVMLLASDGIHVWPTAKPRDGILISIPHGTAVTAAAFDDNSPRLAIGLNDGRVFLYTLTDDGKSLSTKLLTGHTAAVNDLSFTLDGSQLVTASDDSTVRVWWATVPDLPTDRSHLIALAQQRRPVILTTPADGPGNGRQ